MDIDGRYELDTYEWKMIKIEGTTFTLQDSYLLNKKDYNNELEFDDFILIGGRNDWNGTPIRECFNLKIS